MATNVPPPPSSERPRKRRDVLERLYVYWLASTVLLVLVAIGVVIVTRGAVQGQARRTEAATERVAAVEKNVKELASALAAHAEAAKSAASPAPAGREAATGSGDQRSDRRPAAGTSPVATTPAVTPESRIQSQLDSVLSDAPASPADVTDPKAAAALLDTALQEIGRARWSGATWSRLAVLARLLGHDATAEAFARHAADAGDALVAYTEVSARALLAHRRGPEALAAGRSLLDRTHGAPAARVLLAAALLATGQPAAADEVVEPLQDVTRLGTRDMLVLARVLMNLEHWERLDAVLAAVGEVPAELSAEYNFLQAVALARAGRAAEAYAVLEYVAAHFPSSGATTHAAGELEWPAPGPDRYEVEVWRGVTLMHAQKEDAAREVLLQAAQRSPGRPEAHYYLGLLEARAGQRERARFYLQNALACSARLAPAWEALAILELDSGETNAALEHLSKAIEGNPRRASAHFLLAIAEARLAQREAAAGALQTALRLDPRYLTEAKQTEVLLRLFTPAEMDEWAATAGAEAMPASQPTSAGGPPP